MERRGFLKATAAAVLGGRKIAADVAASVGGMGLSSSAPIKGLTTAMNPLFEGPEKDDWFEKEITRHTKRLLRGFTDAELRNLRDEARHMALQSLDSDLFVNRSLSLSAKIHLQTEREFARLQEYRRTGWENSLRQLKKAALGGGGDDE